MHPPVRLVAIDMDGTLLGGIGKAISPRNARALKAAEEAGIVVVIATGRRVAFTAPPLNGMGLRAETPLITSNGAVTAMLGGDIVESFTMPASIARGLCTLLRPFGVLVFTFGKQGYGELVLEDLEQTKECIALWVEANHNAIQVVKPLELAFPDGQDPIQGMVAGSIAKMRQAAEMLKSTPLAAYCAAIRTEYPARDLSIVDLLPMGVSKGWALQRLAQTLGVDRSETMAIGDNWNDVDMLEWAGQAVLMGNAAPELKAKARTNGWKQTPRNDEDGVAVALEKAIRENGIRVKTIIQVEKTLA